MRALVGVLPLLACSALTRRPELPYAPPTPHDAADEAPMFRDASLEARVADAETAWLVAHLADASDPTHAGESDAVRRLADRGAPGVLAVAEVFRVGDTHRLPYARRVIERVLERRCLRDRVRVARIVTWLYRGDPLPTLAPDAGVVWQGEERWSNASVDRLRAWALAGAPCDPIAMDAGT